MNSRSAPVVERPIPHPLTQEMHPLMGWNSALLDQVLPVIPELTNIEPDFSLWIGRAEVRGLLVDAVRHGMTAHDDIASAVLTLCLARDPESLRNLASLALEAAGHDFEDGAHPFDANGDPLPSLHVVRDALGRKTYAVTNEAATAWRETGLSLVHVPGRVAGH